MVSPAQHCTCCAIGLIGYQHTLVLLVGEYLAIADAPHGHGVNQVLFNLTATLGQGHHLATVACPGTRDSRCVPPRGGHCSKQQSHHRQGSHTHPAALASCWYPAWHGTGRVDCCS